MHQSAPVLPSFILQPASEPEEFRDIALTNLGLDNEEKKLIPKMSGIRPDVLYVREAIAGEYEVLPNGGRKIIEAGDTGMKLHKTCPHERPEILPGQQLEYILLGCIPCRGFLFLLRFAALGKRLSFFHDLPFLALDFFCWR